MHHVNPPATRIPRLLHGADYNPEQWPESTWDQDMRLMKLAGVNAVSVGIFSWAMLEPEEGRFEFDWLDRLMDKLAEHEIAANLATPTAAMPNWMGAKYPEIRRCDPAGNRKPQGGRVNFCYTSPIYREKATIINTKLAERYKDHPALVLWHVCNEYNGACHCPLCKQAFRDWLREKYRSLDALNHAWWATFWSHRYTDWSQIDRIDPAVHGLVIDWQRFVTHQTVDFFRHESQPLRRLSPDVPITTNTMGLYPELDYWKFVPHVDVMCWDAYPRWHVGDTAETAYETAFICDLYRAYKPDRPWLLLESTPSQTNWARVSPLKRPGVHRLASLQTIAHGSDSVMYFQWRKSRGSCEKFHGAVVDHVGHENTRVFQDVAALGQTLGRLNALVGQTHRPEVAVVYDWENRWALETEKGPQNACKEYQATCVRDFYAPFWKRNVSMDVIDSEQDFLARGYRLLLAPMLYMLKPGVADRLKRFVEAGGTLVTTYFTGLVDENDLCFLGGWPGDGLRELTGVWMEETDALPEDRRQHVAAGENDLGLTGTYEARHYFDLIHAEDAQVLGTYASDFYAGRPAVTRRRVGRGQVIHIASRNDARFHDDLAEGLARQLQLRTNLPTRAPEGVSVQRRGEHLFVLNFTSQPQTVALPENLVDAETSAPVGASLQLPGYGSAVLRASA